MLTLESFEKYTKHMEKTKKLKLNISKKVLLSLSKNYCLSGWIFIFSLFLIIQGCAPAISPSVKKDTNLGLNFKRVIKNPDLFKGEKILWGGKIVSTKYQKKGTLIEVIQIPLDYFDKPTYNTSSSKGRFLIQSPWFLDSEVYKKGKDLTVAGIIKGTRIKKIGEFQYPYPLIEPLEIKLWEPLPEYPSYYYDPFFYDPYFYDPFTYDPYFSPFPKRHRRHKRYPSDWHSSHGDCNFWHPPDYDDNC